MEYENGTYIMFLSEVCSIFLIFSSILFTFISILYYVFIGLCIRFYKTNRLHYFEIIINCSI